MTYVSARSASLFLTVLWCLIALATSLSAGEKPSRVLSIGGSVTEIIYALGEDHRLVGRDTTSTYPAEAMDLPDVGYMRRLSAEGVLSVEPDLIIAREGSGPPEAISVLQAASIPMVKVPDFYTPEGLIEKITTVGVVLGVEDKAEALAAEVAEALTEAREASRVDSPKRVMFVLSTQGGRIMASGAGTAADAIIRLAGGENALADFEGYKPVTDEAVSAAAPDVILMMDRMGDHATSDDDLFAMPAMIPTPAAETRAIVRMNGLYLLGFGPRSAEAVRDLNRALYGG
ncbi:MAG: ABC transporter substrate-binding protein [Silicimonas sp.]|nr:ABC transporter substrate-binding protein [Silicimonas sp.]